MTVSDPQNFGPDEICRRTACAERDAHVGGVHLDPTSPLYDGPDTLLRALTFRVRDKTFALLHASRGDAWNRQVVDVALDAMGREIHHLNDQIAHVRADADHKVLGASKRALDCKHHGKTIQRLEDQVHHFDRAAARADAARLALLGGIHTFDEFVSAIDARKKAGEPLPEMAAVLEFMRKTLKRVHTAHTRAWSK